MNAVIGDLADLDSVNFCRQGIYIKDNQGSLASAVLP